MIHLLDVGSFSSHAVVKVSNPVAFCSMSSPMVLLMSWSVFHVVKSCGVNLKNFQCHVVFYFSTSLFLITLFGLVF